MERRPWQGPPTAREAARDFRRGRCYQCGRDSVLSSQGSCQVCLAVDNLLRLVVDLDLNDGDLDAIGDSLRALCSMIRAIARARSAAQGPAAP